MVFFSESPKELKSGVFGFGITLITKNLRLTPELRAFVLPFKSKCGQIETAFDFGFLSRKASPLGLYVGVHGHINEGQLPHFLLHLGRKPASPPPAHIIQTSQKLGGYPSGFLKLIATLDAQTTECHATFKALIVDSKRWTVELARPKLPKKIGQFEIEHEAIHFENKHGKTKAEIAYLPGERLPKLNINSTVNVNLDSDCFESASEQLWVKVNSLFETK
jgi:hypothetical protein